jgi:hypothetical protein
MSHTTVTRNLHTTIVIFLEEWAKLGSGGLYMVREKGWMSGPVRDNEWRGRVQTNWEPSSRLLGGGAGNRVGGEGREETALSRALQWASCSWQEPGCIPSGSKWEYSSLIPYVSPPLPSSAMKTETVCFSETSALTHKTTWCQNPKQHQNE